MNTSRNTTRLNGWKKSWLIFLILFSINTTWTHSQIISNTESREITYTKLGEFAKYVEFKKQADSLIPAYLKQLSIKDSLISIKDKKLFQYEFSIVPSFQSRILIKDSAINNQKNIFSIKEEMYTSEIKKQKGKKWTWLGGGALFGMLAMLFFGG